MNLGQEIALIVVAVLALLGDIYLAFQYPPYPKEEAIQNIAKYTWRAYLWNFVLFGAYLYVFGLPKH